MPATPGYIVHVLVDGKTLESVEISSHASTSEVQAAFRSIASITEGLRDSTILKLYRPDGVLVPIGPHIPPTTPDTPYSLRIKEVSTPPIPPQLQHAIDALKAGKTVIDEIHDIRKGLSSVKSKVEQLDAFNNAYKQKDVNKKPAVARVEKASDKLHEEVLTPFYVTADILESLKTPSFDVWKYKESELIFILIEIFRDLGLLETYHIDRATLIRFLQVVRRSYNPNPFHNFRHCFCVTQMMYAIINVTGFREKMTSLEKLVLTVACIGHDLDHPGTNNAYQINAGTELATIYNDSSPLENHHAAMLYTILKKPDTNILVKLSEADYKEVRKLIILCILGTDMAKHGEIINKFKSFYENFNFEDVNHRQTLLQMIVKCSDISNEVRPNTVAEAWVDNLLEEFFCQSDREKAEGLPTAPFMDRQKVTKPSAQVGFIGFVMIPLFEALAKVLPNLEENVLQPIRNAQKYYQGLIDASKASS